MALIAAGETITDASGKLRAGRIADNAVDTDQLADDAVGSAEIGENITFTGDYVDIPSCTTTERDALSAQVGMLIYNSTIGMLQQNNSSGWSSIASPPVYTSVNVSNLEESDTTQTLVIAGSNFDSGASAKLIDNNGTTKNPTTSTRNSSTQITIAYTGGDLLADTVAQPLDIVVTNASGLLTTAENAITIDAKPVWVSPATGGLTDQTYKEDVAISTLNFVATDVETTPTYTISSGALPSGLSLSSAGALTGTPNVNDTYNANGVTHNFDVRADDGTGNTVDRSFSIVRYWNDGSSAGSALAGPKDLVDIGISNSGVYYYQIANYNSGNAFTAYTDFSIDSRPIVLFHNISYTQQENCPINPTTSSTSASGTVGINSEHYLANPGVFCQNIYRSDRNPRWYIGQRNIGGSSLSASNYDANWISIRDISGSTFSDQFDSVPSQGQYTGTLYKQDGNTTTYYYQTGHGSSSGVRQMGKDATVNQYISFEFLAPGATNPDHSWSVWGTSLGHYNGQDRPGDTTNWGWMGYSEY